MTTSTMLASLNRHHGGGATTLLLSVTLLVLTGHAQQKPGVSRTTVAARPIPLNAKGCRPATLEQKNWADYQWAPFESHEIACPLRTGGRIVLVVLSVDAYEIEKTLPAQAPAPKYPRALIVTPGGRAVGNLPFAFPFDPPVSLDVAFADWKDGLPRTVELYLEDPAVGGNRKLPSLKWDEKLARYIQTEVSYGR